MGSKRVIKPRDPPPLVRCFIDFEFNERGPVIEPISLGIVKQPAAPDSVRTELYIEFDFDPAEVKKNPWVWQRVVPLLTVPVDQRASIAEARAKIIEFIPNTIRPEFWGFYADYDWVIWCHRIFGGFLHMPQHFPHLCYDLKQKFEHQGAPAHLVPPQPENQHHALADARWNCEFFNRLETWK